MRKEKYNLGVDRGMVSVLRSSSPTAEEFTEQEACRMLVTHAELLAACEELLEHVEAERGWTGEADAEAWVIHARAVVKKAKGEG